MVESPEMSDPLSIPDDKRAGSGRISLFERPDRPHRGWSFWIVVVVLVALNCWYDYYHPPAILLDIIIIIVLAVRIGLRSRRE